MGLVDRILGPRLPEPIDLEQAAVLANGRELPNGVPLGTTLRDYVTQCVEAEGRVPVPSVMKWWNESGLHKELEHYDVEGRANSVGALVRKLLNL